MRLFKCIRFSLRSKSRRRIANHRLQKSQITITDEKKRSKKSFVKELSWEEVEELTGNFSEVIGHGGFSTVYLGASPVSSSALAAFKVQNSSERLDKVFYEELNINVHVQHKNIVKLLGYCNSQDRKVLVFEYISNRTLQEWLHGKLCERGSVIPWKTRMMIAFQLAQAIEYLHDKCGLHLVHHDLKSSNTLLDEDFNCKLCDFGSAKKGHSSLYPSKKLVMLGSPGYTDPNYLITGIASKKNDIYSFGILLLELITGMEAVKLERTLTRISLKDYAIYFMDLVDSRLHGNFDLEEAKVMFSISELCLDLVPGLRPSATDIVQIMKQRVPSVSLSCK